MTAICTSTRSRSIITSKGISQFMPKDKDLSFGGFPLIGINRAQNPLLANASKNVLIRRALNVPAVRNSYFVTISALAQLAGPGNWMESEITRINNQIHQ